MGMAVKVGSMAEGTVTGTVGSRAMATHAIDLHPGDRGVAQIAGAGGAVAMDIGNNVTGMTPSTKRNACDPTVVLDQMVGKIVGVGAVAIRAGGGQPGVDGILHYLADPVVMASGAGASWVVAWAIMQGNDLVRGGQGAVTVIASRAPQGNEMTVGLDMAHRMAGYAGYSYWRRGAGVALASLHGILDILAHGVAMAGHAVAIMDGIDVAHASCHMAGGAAHGNGDHVMLDRGRWDWVIKGVLRPVAVGAILWQAGTSVGNGAHDLRDLAVMALDTGIAGAAEGHDMNDPGGIRVRTVVTV